MAIFKRSQVVNAPIDNVFSVITDGEHWASWNPTIRASRRLDDGPIREGTRFEWDLRGVGKVIQELQEFDPPRQVLIVSYTKQTSGGHRFRLTAQGKGTRIDHELEVRPKGAYVLLAPMMWMIGRKDLRDTADALQRRVEK